MRSIAKGPLCRLVGTFALLSIALCAGSSRHPAWGLYPSGWPGFAWNAQHWGRPSVAAQPLNRIKWSTPVDLAPSGGAHYGTPMMTPANMVVLPIRTGSSFRVEGRRASDGVVQWTLNTAYVAPSSGWVPACGATLTPQGAVAIPDSGGRVLVRASADAVTSSSQDFVFYGAANYAVNPAAYNSAVKINTPITSDAQGNLYFGYAVSGTTPLNLVSGFARITPSGQATYISGATAANDTAATRSPHNCAPALSFTGKFVYVAVQRGGSGGYLLRLDSTTLAQQSRVRLLDPHIGGDADLTDFSTASPTIGPDGQVFYGILDAGLNNNDRGWMLHFNANLSTTLAPGGFGWDNTCSIIPASSVPSYTGPSSYLLLSKYNNYTGIGTGDGLNKVAVLDPSQTQTDPISGITIMKEIMTKIGPTPDPGGGPGAVREWCINNAAVDVIGHAGMVNNEDGKLYKWDFNTNTLAQTITLTSGTSEAYTPTVIGPDGTVYAINAATLYAVGQ